MPYQGGNRFDPATLINGATALMQGIYGTPDQLLEKRKFELALQEKERKSENALALSAAFEEPLKRSGKFYSAESLPLPQMAQAGNIGSASPLIRALNEPLLEEERIKSSAQNARLSLSPFNSALAAHLEAGGDPTQLKPYDDARAYASTLASEDKQREFGLETDKVRAQRGIFDVNASPYAAALRILNDPSISPEDKQAQIDTILRFQKAAGAGADPELKAKADLNKERLRLETGITPLPAGQTSIAQAEQDIKTGGSIAEIIATAKAKQDYLDRGSAAGSLEYNLSQAGLGPMERARFKGDEDIRIAQDKARSDILAAQETAKAKSQYPDISTATGAKVQAMRDAGYGKDAIAAVLMDALTLPKDATLLAAPGDPRVAQFKDMAAPPEDNSPLWRISQIQQGMSPVDAMKSMSKEELLAYKQQDPDALKALYEAVKPPAEGSVIRRGNILSQVKYKPVPEKVDIELGKLNDSLAQLNKAIEATSQKGSENVFSFRRGVQSNLPIIGQSYLEGAIKPEGVRMRADVFDPIAREKHEIYGAALTGGERIDAKAFLPSEYDDAKSAREKLTQLRDRVASVIESRLNTYTPSKGYSMPAEAERAASLIQQFTEERAKQSAKKRKGQK